MQTYAFSTPRWRDKGVDKLLKIFGEFKKGGVRVKLALINAHCASHEDQDNVEIIKDFARVMCGLEEEKDYFLSSEHAQERYDQSFSYPPKKER